MIPALEIQLSERAVALMRRFEDLHGLMAALAREIDLQTQLTAAHIVEKRLTGAGPFPVSDHRLGVRTNLLRNSVRASSATVSGDTITSGIGTNVKYAGTHEFGLTIRHKARTGTVRLRTDRKGILIRQKDGKLAVFARNTHKQAKAVQYQGKAYEITYPERAPFRFGIRDRADAMGNGVSRAAIKFWEGGGR